MEDNIKGGLIFMEDIEIINAKINQLKKTIDAFNDEIEDLCKIRDKLLLENKQNLKKKDLK